MKETRETIKEQQDVAMYNDELYFGESRGRDTIGECGDSYEENVTGFVLNKMANSLS